MFKEKQQQSTKLSVSPEAPSNNAGAVPAEPGAVPAEPGTASAASGADVIAQSHASRKTDDGAAAPRGPDTKQPGMRRPQAPVPWWRRHLQWLIIGSFTTIALPVIFFNHGVTGDAMVKAGNLKQAIAAYQQAIISNPRDALSRDHLARIYMNQAKFDKSIALFSQALAIDPKTDPDLRDMRALCYLAQNQNKKALEDLQAEPAGYQLHPLSRIRALMAAGNKEAAKKIVDEHLKGSAPPGIATKVAMLREAGRYDEALKLCNEQLSSGDAYNASVWRERRGDVLSAKGEFESAIQEYRGAEAARPNTPLLIKKQAEALVKLGRIDQAIERYQETIRLCHDYWHGATPVIRAQSLIALSDLYQSQGNSLAATHAKRMLSLQYESEDEISNHVNQWDLDNPERGIAEVLFGEDTLW